MKEKVWAVLSVGSFALVIGVVMWCAVSTALCERGFDFFMCGL